MLIRHFSGEVPGEPGLIEEMDSRTTRARTIAQGKPKGVCAAAVGWYVAPRVRGCLTPVRLLGQRSALNTFKRHCDFLDLL